MRIISAIMNFLWHHVIALYMFLLVLCGFRYNLFWLVSGGFRWFQVVLPFSKKQALLRKLIEAMKVVCGYEEAEKPVATPSLIVKCGRALVAEFSQIRYLMENYEKRLKEITNSLHLQESGWALYSNTAFRKMDEKEDNTQELRCKFRPKKNGL